MKFCGCTIYSQSFLEIFSLWSMVGKHYFINYLYLWDLEQRNSAVITLKKLLVYKLLVNIQFLI